MASIVYYSTYLFIVLFFSHSQVAGPVMYAAKGYLHPRRKGHQKHQKNLNEIQKVDQFFDTTLVLISIFLLFEVHMSFVCCITFL